MKKILMPAEQQEVKELGELFSQVSKRKQDYVRGYLEATVDVSKEFAKQSARAREGNKAA